MAVDKNLFLYDLAVVAIMKNEAPYVKEWLDYHLLAGVEHFYIYDNDSPDNLREVLQPYIDAGTVTYKFYPGTARQYEAYNEAIQNYRFFCRYMAFIDADEFIFPQNDKRITEVVDEIFAGKPNAGGLAINWMLYGSNYQEKADYTKGLLERFTRRAPVNYAPPDARLGNLPGGNAHVKVLVNPRKVHHFGSPHFANYFDGFIAVNSNGQHVPLFYNNPPTIDKIVINHYFAKSREEFFKKIDRGTADNKNNIYNLQFFQQFDHNEVFDDSILKYRAKSKTAVLENYQTKYNRIYIALLKNLSPTFTPNAPLEIFANKLETFLICRKLAEYLREKVFNKTVGNFFEEVSLEAVHKTLSTNMMSSDFKLLISELPNILQLNYPVAEHIRKTCINVIPKVLEVYKTPNIEGWKEFIKLQYLMKMLQLSNPDKN